MAIYNPDNFPIDALPPLLRDAVLDLHEVIKAPIPIAVASVLAALSLVVSGRHRVKRFNGIVTGLALYLLIIAESGERKTSSDNLAILPLLEFDEQLLARWREAFAEYQAAMTIWATERNGAKIALKRAIAAGSDCEMQRRRLMDVLERQPVEPVRRSLILRDITPDALIQRLSVQPTISVFSSEGGALCSARTFNNLGLFNIIWESGSLSVDRKSQAPLVVKDPSLTLSVMIQEGPLKQFSENKGAQARNSGFMARCLVSQPTSTQGQRFEYSASEIQTEGLARFHTRIRELLEVGFGAQHDPNAAKRLLQFDYSAKECAREYTNSIEMHLQPNALLSDVRDAASKIADNMARLAGLFHLCNDPELNEIPSATVKQACAVSDWYLGGFKRVFGEVNIVPGWQQDAELLRNFLFEMAMRQNCWQFRQNDLRQYAPNRLRNQRFAAALQVLANWGVVRFYYVGKVRWIQIGQVTSTAPMMPMVAQAKPVTPNLFAS
ncbi:YfjI family protein [Dechloromonas hortensis]|uniref:YfjI family protein n=1 Tax=Dechloromonas hortensis TaxID=337779 RepID=UPI001291313E|nr:YfjI family protein [Dechloromonas hortensis]